MYCFPLVIDTGLGKGFRFQERLYSRSVKVVDAVHSGYRDSLRYRDRSGGHVCNFALERVARIPPLYPAGNSDINSPFEVEFLARFDDNEWPCLRLVTLDSRIHLYARSAGEC